MREPKRLSLSVRTSAELRDALFDELDRIRAGTSNPTCANAVAKLASGVIESVRATLKRGVGNE